MDNHPVALHASEPCHLPFGETPYVGIEVLEHRLIGVVLGEVSRHVFIFQTVAQQTFFRNAVVEQPLHLVDHALFETLSEALSNTLHDFLARETHADYEMSHDGEVGVCIREFLAEFMDFKGAEEAVACFGVGVVVERGKGCEATCQLFVAEWLHGGAERFADRCVGQLVAAHDGFDVESGAAAHYGGMATSHDVVEGLNEVVLKAVDAVFLAGVADVDEVVGNAVAINGVVGQVLAGADIHAAEHLARIGADDFAVEPIGQSGG